MQEVHFIVPTYYGQQNSHLSDKSFERLEFSDPLVPILVRGTAGLRLLLGSYGSENDDVPDILVQRRPHGWAIFLHPIAGRDISGSLYFLDDGRSFIVPGNGIETPRIRVLHWKGIVAKLDRPESGSGPNEFERTNASPREACEYCESELQCSGDNWDTLCPECADLVSLYLDRMGLNDEDRDMVVAFLKQGPPLR